MSKLFIVATALLGATAASAGVRIQTVERNIQTKAADKPPQTILIQDGNVRVSTSQSGAMIIKGSTILIVDDQRKTYREMDKAALQGMANQASAAMAQMQGQMAKMSPQQREMMQKMLGGSMPGAPVATAAVFATKNTGKSETVEGRKCQLWNITLNGNPHEEVCVVPFASLPGKENFQKTFKSLAEAFEGMTAALPAATTSSSKAYSDINGYPVRVRRYTNGKPDVTETVLKSWTEESIAAASFQTPAGYKKQEMPAMGSR